MRKGLERVTGDASRLAIRQARACVGEPLPPLYPPPYLLATSHRGCALDDATSRSAQASRIRRDDAPRRLVASSARGIRRTLELPGVRDLGGVPERQLRVRQLPVAVLFAAAVRPSAARVV